MSDLGGGLLFSKGHKVTGVHTRHGDGLVTWVDVDYPVGAAGDEIEVTLRDDLLHYRELRYAGDDTARWVGLDRAIFLVGSKRIVELVQAALRVAAMAAED